MARLALAILTCVVFVLLTGPVCGPQQPKPFQITIGEVDVPKTPGQNGAWDQPISFAFLNGTPQVCRVEFEIQTFYDIPSTGLGPCTTPEFPFDINDTTLSDNNCVYGTNQGFDPVDRVCWAWFEADCTVPFSSFESLPPARLFDGDDAGEFLHSIAFLPLGAAVEWDNCTGAAGSPKGKSVLGKANVYFE